MISSVLSLGIESQLPSCIIIQYILKCVTCATIKKYVIFSQYYISYQYFQDLAAECLSLLLYGTCEYSVVYELWLSDVWQCITGISSFTDTPVSTPLILILTSCLPLNHSTYLLCPVGCQQTWPKVLKTLSMIWLSTGFFSVVIIWIAWS